MIDIENMTLFQAKEYCENHCTTGCYNDRKCELAKRKVCHQYVHGWKLDCLTLEEFEICKLLGAKWLTREEAEPTVIQIWNEKPRCAMFDGKKTYEGAVAIAQIDPEKFPSVKPGDCINVGELIGGESDG